VPLTPKQRMLNAYRGLPVDVRPVAPEFWYYYPAKVLRVDMIQLQREVPFWFALKTTFEKFGCEGWGTVWCGREQPKPASETHEFIQVAADSYELRSCESFAGRTFRSTSRYSKAEPSWQVEYPVKDPFTELDCYFDMRVQHGCTLTQAKALEARNAVGEAFLLECVLPGQFTDFLASAMGFEMAVQYLMTEESAKLESYQKRYRDYVSETTGLLAATLPFESYFMGCSYSCASLMGPRLWRQWDVPIVAAAASAIHRHGKLMHLHYHGKSLENAADLASTGVDCVCPFERPPGGDVDGLEGLQRTRALIGEKLTFNGNVHTVATLIRGTRNDVRREVGQIKSAFADSHRLIIGTGDQVGRETPEENLHVMVEAGHEAS